MLYISSFNDFLSQTFQYAEKDTVEWTCLRCNKVHKDEKRNVKRRKFYCSCEKLNIQIASIQERLQKHGYEMLHEELDSYTLGKRGDEIDTTKPILVRCLNCGKEKKMYIRNIFNNHVKCNCDPTKHYTNNLTIQEFINKWPALNQENWELLDSKYLGRNAKYKVRCRRCGKEDSRWGISLIDNELQCKYCSKVSLGEQKISRTLQEINVKFSREYHITINGHNHFFDFYLPDYNAFIEFNGEQHYIPIEYFGGQERFEKQRFRDQEKINWCNNNGYHFLVVKYDNEDIKTTILNFLKTL